MPLAGFGQEACGFKVRVLIAGFSLSRRSDRLIIVHDTIWRFVNVDCEANTHMSGLRLESLINSTDRFEFEVHNCFQFCLSN